MKKTIMALLLLGVTLLGGCSMEQKVTIHQDLSSLSVMDTYTTVAEENAWLAQQGAPEGTSFTQMMTESGYTYVGTKEVEGQQYNWYTMSSQNDVQETKGMFIELTNQKAIKSVASESEMKSQEVNTTSSMNYGDMGFYNLTITYPFQVGKTNGSIQPDGCTVVYDLKAMQAQKQGRAYAVSASAVATSDALTIQGVKNKKIYKKPVTLTASSDGVISSFTVNGVEQQANSYYAEKDGKYEAVLQTASGQKKALTFYVDRKKPTTNVKNNKTYKKAVKITFKDKVSGIKKATLNGKKIKSGKTVKKNGTYTLKITDKAGNTKTVKFTINK